MHYQYLFEKGSEIQEELFTHAVVGETLPVASQVLIDYVDKRKVGLRVFTAPHHSECRWWHVKFFPPNQVKFNGNIHQPRWVASLIWDFWKTEASPPWIWVTGERALVLCPLASAAVPCPGHVRLPEVCQLQLWVWGLAYTVPQPFFVPLLLGAGEDLCVNLGCGQWQCPLSL